MSRDNSLGEKITTLRRRKKWTQGELAEKSGVHRSLISLYEADKQIPHIKNLIKIAKTLEIDVNELLRVEQDETQEKFMKEYPGLKNYFDLYSGRFIHVPILGKVHAGKPNEIPENLIIGGIDLPIEIAKGSDYALRVTGMSMKEEGIDENDIILIRLQKYAENDQICIARINDEKYVIRKLRNEDGRIWLESANIIYEPITKNFEVVGIIVGLVKKFK